mmetsp:Transcript_11805/g.33646  ORF Transcript_11805/g.33646 Transcript_11805/m.33646 type:complete len:223 (-) Transcript_11805:613-1281(-)
MAAPWHIVWGAVEENQDSGHGSSSNGGMSPSLSGVKFEEGSSSEAAGSILGLAGLQGGGGRSCGDGRLDEESARTGQERDAMEQILAKAGHWSVGSAKHETETCKPCRYVYSRVGCANGQACPFCHLPHTDQSRKRIGLSKRQYCKTLATSIRDACKDDEALQEVMRTAAAKSNYLQTILQERVADPEPLPVGESKVCGADMWPSSRQVPAARPARPLKLSL